MKLRKNNEWRMTDMTEYIYIVKNDDRVSVCFNIEKEEIMTIGDKINEINEDAYMNGYNWGAFFNYYLTKYAPNILEEMESDPEAGMYLVYYNLTSENEMKAQNLMKIIRSLIEDENKLYQIIKNEGEEIEWD